MYCGECRRAFLALLRAGLPFFGGGVRAHVRARHEVEDPAVKGGFVLQRHTQDLADHRHRDRVGVLVDDVEGVAALGLRLIEQFVAQRLDVGLHVGDDVRGMRRREVPHHLPALLVVLGRVGHDQARLPAVGLHVVGADVGLRMRRRFGRDRTLRRCRS